jgi:hypothetical protein
MANNTVMVYALSLLLVLAVVYYFKPSLFNFMMVSQGFENEEDDEEGFDNEEDDEEGFENEEDDEEGFENEEDDEE